jgi:DNA-binding response OmpR family regulator
MRILVVEDDQKILSAIKRGLERQSYAIDAVTDYLVKPFAFVELIARVRALLRRPQEAIETSVESDGVMLDRDTFTAIRDEQTIELTAKEFALLEYLMSQPGRIHTKDQLMQHVWDYDADILPNTVEVYIGYLRNKIDKPFPKLPSLINTRRGFGYYFGVGMKNVS